MLKNNKATVLTTIILIILSVVCIGIRVKCRHKSIFSQQGTVWQLTYDLELHADKVGQRLYVTFPSDTVYAKIVSETFSRQGLAVDILHNKNTLEREAVLAVSDYSRPLKFMVQFVIQLNSDVKITSKNKSKSFLSTVAKAEYLRKENYIQKDDPSVKKVLQDISQGNIKKTQLIDEIFNYCSENLIHADDSSISDAAGSFISGNCNALGCARAMVALCRTSRIPARLVTGFILEGNQELIPTTWVEVYCDKQWVPHDPINGYSGQLPANYLPVRHGGIRIARAPKGCIVRANYKLNQLNQSAGLIISSDGSWDDILDLTRLPVGMKKTLSLILLLPIGALISAFFRNIIGLQTFGIFTPTLLALSLVNSDWKTGIIVFVLVMGVGLLCRLLLGQLKLLAVPRLGIILTLVVLCLAGSISILEHYGFAPSARSILLPIVIVTVMIERFYISLEEDGTKITLKMLFYTIIVAACCFFILHFEPMGWLVITFPEVQLLIVAMLIMIGRYSGYRLCELWRFRDVIHLKN